MSKQQIDSQINQAQGFAVDIEFILRDIFECDRFGFGGQINSDAIRIHPFLSMTQGLAYLYALYPQKRNACESFIENFCHYEDKSLDYILSFDTNEKIIYSTIEQIERIEKENGLEQVQFMISEFEKVVGK